MKLPQLQNLVKRDPSAYREEYLQQKRAYEAEARLFTLRPSRDSPRFLELVTFMSHVAACYAKEEEKEGEAEGGVSVAVSLPAQLTTLLEESAVVMLPATRKTLVQALILLRNRGLLEVRKGGREGGRVDRGWEGMGDVCMVLVFGFFLDALSNSLGYEADLFLPRSLPSSLPPSPPSLPRLTPSSAWSSASSRCPTRACGRCSTPTSSPTSGASTPRRGTRR
jgi:hypothetical protein